MPNFYFPSLHPLLDRKLQLLVKGVILTPAGITKQDTRPCSYTAVINQARVKMKWTWDAMEYSQARVYLPKPHLPSFLAPRVKEYE